MWATCTSMFLQASFGVPLRGTVPLVVGKKDVHGVDPVHKHRMDGGQSRVPHTPREGLSGNAKPLLISTSSIRAKML